MDERGATNLCDLLTKAASPPAPEATLDKSLHFIVLRGSMPGRMIRLSPGLAALGRAPENGIQLADMSVSRAHASIRVDDHGHAWLTDLGSTNGTFLNTQRLAPRVTVGLRDGDRIGFGPSFLLKFVQTDALDEHHHREMFERSVRDPLTGLYNRSYFLNQMSLLVHQTYQRNVGLAIVMLDIDHFKRINDTFGHEAGDDVLRHVASVLRQSTRENDLVARYGGEEFIAALPIASEPQALHRADRMRIALKQQTLTRDGRFFQVTGSFGVAFGCANSPRSIERLISSADQALYDAKANGRDRVVLDAASNRDPLAELDHSDARHVPLAVESAESVEQTGLTTVDYDIYPSPGFDSP